MKNKFLEIDFKYKVVILTFFLFLVISFLSPLTGDDWSNYTIGKNGFIHAFTEAWDMYFANEGRFVSRVLINLLVCNKIIFNIVFSFLMSGIVYVSVNMIGVIKNKYYYLLPLIGLLVVNTLTFAENYTWVTGSITYTFPAIITILYFVYLSRKESFEFSSKEILVLSIINLIAPMFVENIGVAFVFGNIVVIMYRFIRYKKISKVHLFLTIISIISIALMVFSPGSVKRMDLEGDFYALTRIEQFKLNLSNFIKYTFTRNFVLLLGMTIPINYYLYHKYKKWIYSRLLLVTIDLVVLFTLLCNFFVMIPVNINLVMNIYDGIFAADKWYFIIFWFIYFLLFVASVLNIIKDTKKRESLLLLLLIGIVSNVVMMVSPVWGERVAILWVLALIIVLSVLFVEMGVKLPSKIMITCLLLLIIYYISCLVFAFCMDISRKNRIEEQLASNKEIIDVEASPILLLWNYNPTHPIQVRKFKNFYNIPQEKEINVRYYGIFERLQRDVKNQ